MRGKTIPVQHMAVWWLMGMLLYPCVVQTDHGKHNQPSQSVTAPRRVKPSGTGTPVLQLLDIYECTKCHRLTEPYRLVGPSLWKLGERANAAAIRAAILTPDAVVAPGYPDSVMYTHLQGLGFYEDIKRQPEILERLVAYLAGQQPPEGAPSAPSAAAADFLAKMLPLPAGSVQLPSGQSVTVGPFFIDPAPITNAQYKAFIADGGYKIKRYWEREGWALIVQRRQRTQPRSWPKDAHVTADAPVVGVSWYEAQAYCTWAGKTLPTAFQWQRACQELPDWYRPEAAGAVAWEWSAEGVWKGTQEATGSSLERCLARVPSYPALDGQDTGFRCALEASPSP